MSQIRINRGRFVSLPVRLGVTILVSIALINLAQNIPEMIAIPIAIILSVIIPALWFSFLILTIDTNKKLIIRSVWLMGIKMDKSSGFKKLNHIEIRSELLSKQARSYPGEKVHKAFLHFDEEEILLLSRKNVKTLQKKIEELNLKLDLVNQE